MKIKNIYTEKLSATLNTYQHSIADKIQECTKHFSSGKKKIILIVFCLVFGTMSLFLIFEALIKKFSPGDLSIGRISIPYHIGKNYQQPFGIIDTATYNRVERFKFYLYSLKTTNALRFETIIDTRPHLIDSIIAFEKIYQSQLKK